MAALSACGGGKQAAPTMQNDQDSMSYVVGMNIAYNILEMDSTINREVLLMGIEDVLTERAKMSQEEAKEYFLIYMNYGVYERVREYEDKYLNDLVATDTIERPRHHSSHIPCDTSIGRRGGHSCRERGYRAYRSERFHPRTQRGNETHWRGR